MKRVSFFFYSLSAFIITGSLMLFVMLPQKWYQPVWKGYQVLAVPQSVDLSACVTAVEAAGIHGSVFEFCIPARFAFLQEQQYHTVPFTQETAYRQWFTDSSGAFRYAYIPYTSFLSLMRLLLILHKDIGTFYLESPFIYSFFAAIPVCILFLYCVSRSSKKVLFTAGAAGFLCYAFTLHNNLGLAAALLGLLTEAYWIEALDGGGAVMTWKQLQERMRRNRLMVVLPVVPFVFAVLSGFVSFLFFCLALVLSSSALFSVYGFLQLKAQDEDKNRLHPSLKVFVMHPDSWYCFWNTPAAIKISLLTAGLVLVAAVSPLLFSSNRLDTFELAVPAPIGKSAGNFSDDSYFAAAKIRTAAALPDLGSYISDCWYESVFPYINVHQPLPPIVKNTRTAFDFFYERSDGTILHEEKTLFEFDTAFISNALQRISAGTFPLETMLIRQGGFTAVEHTYIKTAIFNTRVSFFLILPSLFFPCILIIIARKQ
ncbi:MAG: hypothetical protein ACTTH8_02670 [Treponema sp.]